MPVTRDDVAKLAGVSAATVSYVVNNGPRRVTQETRAKVLRAIEQLGYHPSAVARSLKTKRTHTVGIVISDIMNPILAGIAKSVEDLLFPHGYSLIICNSDESAHRERAWLEMLLSKRVDGIILLPAGGDNLRLAHAALDSGVQIVLIDRQVTGLNTDCVAFDNEGGAYQAIRHLVEMGHSRIGLLSLPSHLTPGRGRINGYMKAFQDSGLMVDPKLIKEGSFKAEEGYAIAGELLSLQPCPTALLVSSNRLAQGVLQQVKERGLRIPGDLALVVFDDVPHFSYMTPSVSAVSYDVKAFAEAAVRFLCQRIDGQYVGEGRTALIPCHLQARESTLGMRGRPSQGGS